jgi:hypothetical protein
MISNVMNTVFVLPIISRLPAISESMETNSTLSLGTRPTGRVYRLRITHSETSRIFYLFISTKTFQVREKGNKSASRIDFS